MMADKIDKISKSKAERSAAEMPLYTTPVSAVGERLKKFQDSTLFALHGGTPAPSEDSQRTTPVLNLSGVHRFIGTPATSSAGEPPPRDEDRRSLIDDEDDSDSDDDNQSVLTFTSSQPRTRSSQKPSPDKMSPGDDPPPAAPTKR